MLKKRRDRGDVPDVAVARSRPSAAPRGPPPRPPTALRQLARRNRASPGGAARGRRRESSSPSSRRAPDRPKAGAPRRRGRRGSSSSGSGSRRRPRSSRARASTAPTARASGRCRRPRRLRASRCRARRPEHVRHEADLLLALGEIGLSCRGDSSPGGRSSAMTRSFVLRAAPRRPRVCAPRACASAASLAIAGSSCPSSAHLRCTGGRLARRLHAHASLRAASTQSAAEADTVRARDANAGEAASARRASSARSRDAIARLGNRGRPCRPSSPAPCSGASAAEDLAPTRRRRSRDLAAAAYEHLTAPRAGRARRHPPHRPRSRARRPAPRYHRRRGRQRQHAVPPRFDPRRARRAGLRAAPRRPSDPRGRARRGRARSCASLGEAPRQRPLARARESFIHIHLDRIDDRGRARSGSPQGLERVYADVARRGRRLAPHARAHRRGDRRLPGQPAAAAGRRGRRGDRLPRLDRRRQFHLPRRARTTASPAATRPPTRSRASGLGLLRDPAVKVLRRGKELVAMTPEVRAFLAEPAGAHHHQGQRQVARAPPRPSRLHRRQAVLGEGGGSKASCASSACSRRAPTPARPSEVPYLRHKVAKVVDARRLRSGELCRPRAAATCSRTIRATSCSRSTRRRSTASPSTSCSSPSGRASGRSPASTSSTASSRSSSSCRRTATTPACAARVGEFLAGDLQGPRLRRLSGLPRRAARPHALHHRPRRGRDARSSIARRSSAASAPSCAPGATPCRPPLAETIGGAAARALAARYANAFSRRLSRGLRRRRAALSDIGILERLSAERAARRRFLPPRAAIRDRASTSRCSRAAAPAALRARAAARESRLPRRQRADLPGRAGRAATTPSASGCTTWRSSARRAAAIDIAQCEAPLEAALLALFRGLGGSDALQQAGARGRRSAWRDVAVLRALRPLPAPDPRPLRQDYLAAHAGALSGRSSASSSSLFYARFDPPATARRAPSRETGRAARSSGSSPRSTSLDDDRILRRFVNLVEAAVRTNFFQIDPTACRARPSPSSSNARGSTACRCRGRSTRFSSIRRASRACICASARSRAAACAGPTGRRISAPRCSAS